MTMKEVGNDPCNSCKALITHLVIAPSGISKIVREVLINWSPLKSGEVVETDAQAKTADSQFAALHPYRLRSNPAKNHRSLPVSKFG
jgi:hypothetical protein